MKLGSLKRGGRDGTLVVVSRDLARATCVPGIVKTLQALLDHWESCCKRVAEAYELLNAGEMPDDFPLEPEKLAAPLPRAYQWCDGSAYLYHVELVRKARKAEMPPSLYDDPLMYQGGSDGFLGANLTDLPGLDAFEELGHVPVHVGLARA